MIEGNPAAFMVNAADAARVWPGVEKLIDAAYEFADETIPADMVDQLSRRYRQLWIVWDGKAVLAAVLTRIVQLRSCRAVQITACGGRGVERWAHLISAIEDFARSEGCARLQIEGRAGWEKVLPGFRRSRVVMEREIPDVGRRYKDHDN